jgi:hypothetical protein
MQNGVAAVALLGLLGFGGDSVNFDTLKPGATPPNWSFGSTRGGAQARWEIRRDPTAPSRGNVLEQVSGTPGPFDFPVAIFDKVVCRDGDLSVKFKIDGDGASKTAGAKTAGIVWRYQDRNNYYLLHFSADEKNIVLFRVRDGKAQAVPAIGSRPGSVGIAHDIRIEQWYVAKVIFRGSRVRVLFGNRRLFDADDSAMPMAGKTGVWTKGRTTASFDDFRIDKKN